MEHLQNKILIVDDEERIRRILRMYLEKEGFAVEEAGEGFDALEKAEQNCYDLIILDLMLPGLDGIELCMRLRDTMMTPIIIVSARGDQSDRLRGFEAGADDYVVKPFSPHEIVYRVKAILQRYSFQQGKEAGGRINTRSISFPSLLIEPQAHRISVDGKAVDFAPKEYELLHFLASHPNETFSREALLSRVWHDEGNRDSRTVDAHVRKIRKKLSQISPQVAEMITTVWGWGYQLHAVEKGKPSV